MNQTHATSVPFLMAFLLLLLPALMLLMWAFLSGLMAVFTGWIWLARSYRLRDEFHGELWSMVSGELGWLKFGGLLTIGSNRAGLYLHQALSIGCPDILIPWSDVSVRHYRRFFFNKTEFTFLRTPFPALRVTRALAEEILQHVRAHKVISPLAWRS